MRRSSRLFPMVWSTLLVNGCGESASTSRWDTTGSSPTSASAPTVAQTEVGATSSVPTGATSSVTNPTGGVSTTNSGSTIPPGGTAPVGTTSANTSSDEGSSVTFGGNSSGVTTSAATTAGSGEDTSPSTSNVTTGPGTTTTAGMTSAGPSGPVELDCEAGMPTSGAQQHSGNGVGGEGNLAWEIWSNTGEGELTTYSVPAFSGSWNEAGGYLGRLGYEWGGFGSDPGPYETHGTITAQFVSNKTGTAGQYSYVGMYGWSVDPCVEWYVVDDSFNNMPINPGGTTNEGEVDIDGGTYIMYTRPTTGSGGTRCDGVTNWIQYYSVRKTARSCGQISLTAHFDAWKGLGMELGNLLEAKIIVEVGGGVGRVDFPIANVFTTQ